MCNVAIFKGVDVNFDDCIKVIVSRLCTWLFSLCKLSDECNFFDWNTLSLLCFRK